MAGGGEVEAILVPSSKDASRGAIRGKEGEGRSMGSRKKGASFEAVNGV